MMLHLRILVQSCCFIWPGGGALSENDNPEMINENAGSRMVLSTENAMAIYLRKQCLGFLGWCSI